ncbi:MAG: TRAM domain-containing protein, partial [Alphaproteobacteria bacterium]|nr:TRAM domain-containing protein [Alphaproteobacteria bacterium]
FIIGFPGETGQDFEDTLNLAREVKYASAYSFKFSARPGTPAAAMKNLVHDTIATERLIKFQAQIVHDQLAFTKSFEGKTIAVLLDRKGKKPGQLQGRSPWGQSVNVSAPDKMLGQIADLRIRESFDNSLAAEMPVACVA